MTRSRRFSLPFLVLAVVMVACTAAPARAEVSFSLGASVGLVEGTASELAFYSYYPGNKFKLSELTWDLKDVVMGGVQGSVGVGRRFRLNLGVWSALTEGNGMMVDRDWIYPPSVAVNLVPNGNNWTDESRHPDTSVDKGTIVDLNLNVLALQYGPFALHGIVGYKNETWNWSARGGTFIYSDLENGGFRDHSGDFETIFGKDVLVIAYEQQYSIPYIGLGAGWTWPRVQLETHLLFSPAVSASDSDKHVLRGVLFEGDFTGGTYVGLGLNAVWTFARHWSATLGVEYQSIPQITGDVKVSGAEGDGKYPGGGGIAMSATSVSLGAGYRF
jgi:outer membrane protease